MNGGFTVKNKQTDLKKKESYFTRKYGRVVVKESKELYLMLLPVAILIFLLSYVPLYGLVIAFQKYVPGAPLVSAKAKWVGFDNFLRFFNGRYFGRLLGNTLRLGVLNLLLGFPIPIIFALLLNEIKNVRFKKVIQTVSYMPYFISTVVVASIVLSFVSVDGLVNVILGVFGVEPKAYNLSPEAFSTIYLVTSIWKSFGWNSILYLSTMSSIDPALYESAKMDGANRMQMVFHITLPGIMPTVAMMLILSAGSVLGANSELILLLYNPTVYETADVFGTFVYRDGLLNGGYSFGAAVNLFATCVNFILLFIANKISGWMTGNSLW